MHTQEAAREQEHAVAKREAKTAEGQRRRPADAAFLVSIELAKQRTPFFLRAAEVGAFHFHVA